MIDHDETIKMILPYLSTILMSLWGGTVAYVQKIRSGEKFSWTNLFMDLIISGFVGFLTHLICTYADLGAEISSVLIAMSAHMGTRALLGLTRIRDSILNRIFGLEDDKNDKES